MEVHNDMATVWRMTPPQTARERRLRAIMRSLMRLYRSLGIPLCRHRLRLFALHWEQLSTAPVTALEGFLTGVLVNLDVDND